MRQLLPLVALAALALPASAQDAAPEPPARDGIHVVGAWTLTVLDPDGSVVERREFHNDLTSVGAEALVNLLLGGEIASGDLAVTLDVSNEYVGERPCDCTGNFTCANFFLQGCVVSTTQFDVIQPDNVFPNLSASALDGDADGRSDSMRLEGFATTENSSVVEVVRTYIAQCPSGTADCDSFPGVLFTERELGTESLPLAAGQTVNVQVDISFE